MLNDKAEAVIYVHDNWHMLRPCIESTLKQTDENSLILRIVDDCAVPHVSKKLEEYARDAQDKIILDRNKEHIGEIESLNKAIRLSNASVMIFLSPASYPTPGALEKVIKFLAQDESAGIACPLSNGLLETGVTIPPGIDILRLAQILKDKYRNKVIEIGHAGYSCVAVKRACINRIGYLDSFFTSAETAIIDYSLRASYYGISIISVPGAFVYHTRPNSVPERYEHEMEIINRRWKEILHSKQNSGLEYVSDFLKSLNIKSYLPKKRGRLTKNNRNNLEILCVLPTMNPYGGVVSVVNMINEFVTMGHHVTLGSLSECRTHLLRCLAEPIWIRQWNKISNLLRGDYDLLIATSWETVAGIKQLAEKSKKGRAVYFVQDMEQTFYDKGDPRYNKALATYEEIDLKIVKTKYLEQQVSAFGGSVHRIRPGMNLDLFFPRPKPAERPPTVLAMLRIGQHHRGYDIILKAMSMIHKARPDVHIIFFGSKDLGDVHIKFPFEDVGIVSNDQMPELYSRADIFLELSRHHGFGRTGLEAMACGTACVLSDLEGPKEYTRNGENALLVPPGDANAAAKAVIKLLDDEAEQKRLIQEGLKTVSGFTDTDAAKEFLAAVERN